MEEKDDVFTENLKRLNGLVENKEKVNALIVGITQKMDIGYSFHGGISLTPIENKTENVFKKIDEYFSYKISNDATRLLIGHLIDVLARERASIIEDINAYKLENYNHMTIEKYYFVSYFFTKENSTGFGNITMTAKKGLFSIREIGEMIKMENEGFTTVIILSFQEIDKNQI